MFRPNCRAIFRLIFEQVQCTIVNALYYIYIYIIILAFKHNGDFSLEHYISRHIVNVSPVHSGSHLYVVGRNVSEISHYCPQRLNILQTLTERNLTYFIKQILLKILKVTQDAITREYTCQQRVVTALEAPNRGAVNSERNRKFIRKRYPESESKRMTAKQKSRAFAVLNIAHELY